MDENRDGLQPENKPDTEHRAGESCPGRRLEKGGGLRRLWQEYGFIPVTVAVMLLLSWQLPYVLTDPVPQRGEVVTFRSDELNKLLVKRVIGLPGDTVSFQDGYVYINGEKLDEPYLSRQGVTASGRQEEYTVPEGCLFFMGDNRTGSYDARSWKEPYIPVGNVRSHVMLCVSVLKGNSWRGICAVS